MESVRGRQHDGTRRGRSLGAVARNPMNLGLGFDLKPSTWLIMQKCISELNDLDVTIVPATLSLSSPHCSRSEHSS